MTNSTSSERTRREPQLQEFRCHFDNERMELTRLEPATSYLRAASIVRRASTVTFVESAMSRVETSTGL
jgi:hypothetical protein